MAKISPSSTKYVIYAQLEVDGIVDKPDVIGAIFGQTEGLLGMELDLRELQKTGRIGRIEAEIVHRNGKTYGRIIIPTSLDVTETALIAALIETVQRIGPCNAKIRVIKIEDVREKKRKYVMERAKELLRKMLETVIPDSQEIVNKIKQEVMASELIEYGEEKLPAGPGIFESDEIIVVEGRADVLNLLKHGITNVIAMNGTKVPKTIIELSKRKIVTAFVDGDRGGDLILKELLENASVDYIVRAPEGKEVEELTLKEIYKALRAKVPVDQYLNQLKKEKEAGQQRVVRPRVPPDIRMRVLKFVNMVRDKGTAIILDPNFQVLGEVPISEAIDVIDKTEAYAIAIGARLTKDLYEKLKDTKVEIIGCIGTDVDPNTAEKIIVSTQ